MFYFSFNSERKGSWLNEVFQNCIKFLYLNTNRFFRTITLRLFKKWHHPKIKRCHFIKAFLSYLMSFWKRHIVFTKFHNAIELYGSLIDFINFLKCNFFNEWVLRTILSIFLEDHLTLREVGGKRFWGRSYETKCISSRSGEGHFKRRGIE